MDARAIGGGAGEIWTIGHWTCPEDAFIRSLQGPGIQLLADVRSQPGSRRNPQFGQEAMRGWLRRAGIGYAHLPKLGGRRGRQPVDPAVNAGWRQPSFKNYADYTLLPAYEEGIRQLAELATAQRVAIICGEPLPWRCHRLLIANTLAARAWTVWHLIGAREPRLHQLGRWGAAPLIDARGRLTYPPPAQVIQPDRDPGLPEPGLPEPGNRVCHHTSR
ncbi:MAG: DUF488 family protein [Streptosporangiaceae bacterium]